jgi:hypothetical protein
LIKTKNKQFSAVKFQKILVIKTLDTDPQLENCWIWICIKSIRIRNPDLEATEQRWKPIHFEQRYTEITYDPLLFGVAQGIFW